MIRGYSAAAQLREVELQVRDVVDYIFCPIKFYLKRALDVKSKETEEAIEGRLAHEAHFYATSFFTEASVNAPKLNLHLLVSYVAERLGNTWPNLSEHLRIVENACRLRLANPPVSTDVEYEKHVRSSKLGLSGSIDLVEGNVPVEVKLRGSLRKADKIQLTLYALILEEELSADVDFGFIDLVSSCQRIKVEIGDKLRAEALGLREEAAKFALTFESAAVNRIGRARCSTCDLSAECLALMR